MVLDAQAKEPAACGAQLARARVRGARRARCAAVAVGTHGRLGWGWGGGGAAMQPALLCTAPAQKFRKPSRAAKKARIEATTVAACRAGQDNRVFAAKDADTNPRSSMLDTGCSGSPMCKKFVPQIEAVLPIYAGCSFVML